MVFVAMSMSDSPNYETPGLLCFKLRAILQVLKASVAYIVVQPRLNSHVLGGITWVRVEVLVRSVYGNAYQVSLFPIVADAVVDVVALALQYEMHLLADVGVFPRAAAWRDFLRKAIIQRQSTGEGWRYKVFHTTKPGILPGAVLVLDYMGHRVPPFCLLGE